MKHNGWFFVALGALFVSILSSFTPMVIYTVGFQPESYLELFAGSPSSVPADGFYGSYNIVDLIGGERFVREVLAGYKGQVTWRIDVPQVAAMAVIALASLLISLFGICTMRSQYHRTWQFVMTVIGLAGTAFPSFLLFYAVSQSQKGFDGVLLCGIAPYLMPFASLVSIIAVIWRRSGVKKEMKRRAQAGNMIRMAGDLSPGSKTGHSSRQGRLLK